MSIASPEPGRWRRPIREEEAPRESCMEHVVVNAAYYGNVAAIQDALRQGADVEELDAKAGWRPLHAAVMTEMEDAVDYLLRQRADINSPGPGGLTALHIACRDESRDVLRLLLKHKADPQVADPTGRTPLDVCGSSNRARRIMEAFAAGAPLPTEDDLDDVPPEATPPASSPPPALAPAPGMRWHASWNMEMRPEEFVDSDDEALEDQEQVASAEPVPEPSETVVIHEDKNHLVESSGFHTYGSAVNPDRDDEEERRIEAYARAEQMNQRRLEATYGDC